MRDAHQDQGDRYAGRGDLIVDLKALGAWQCEITLVSTGIAGVGMLRGGTETAESTKDITQTWGLSTDYSIEAIALFPQEMGGK